MRLLELFQKVAGEIKITTNRKLFTEREIGHLAPLKCGHRGRPSKAEEKLIENLLRESGFIYSPHKVQVRSFEVEKQERLEEEKISDLRKSVAEEDNALPSNSPKGDQVHAAVNRCASLSNTEVKAGDLTGQHKRM